jgi:hypothetical protein
MHLREVGAQVLAETQQMAAQWIRFYLQLVCDKENPLKNRNLVQLFLTLMAFMLVASLPCLAKPNMFVDKAAGFQLTAPDGWKSDVPKAKTMRAEALFFGPNQSKDFRSNINVMVQRCPDIKTYTKLTLDQLKNPSVNGVVVSQKDLKAGKADGHQLIWKATMGGRKLQFNSTYFCVGGKTFLFTGTSLESNWKDVEKLYDASSKTFQPAQ